VGFGSGMAVSAAEQERSVMTGERWQEIRTVLEAALPMDSEKRRAYLDQACASDPSLRREVESLLAADKQAQTGFLESPPLARKLEKGTRLGEYEIQSLLGAGGMGEVYRARDLRLRRDVAVKVLPSVVSADPERLRRFEQEATAAAALNHPNILAVHQLGTYAGTPYLVSELLEGETLREQMRHGRIVPRRVIDYGVQIAHGLAAAHEKGVVHRDLKPENLFVTKDGRVKILDFGLAKLTQAQPNSAHSAPTMGGETEPGLVMGTVGYMSPEQVRGQAADHRADIFALGVILYEMLTGKRAFQKPTSPETMSAILNEDPPEISQVAPNLPLSLQRVVHRCLEKNPGQRFQSASDLAFALEAISDISQEAVSRTRGIKESKRAMVISAFEGLRRAIPFGLAAIGALALIAYWWNPPQLPRVLSYAQITHDGRRKHPTGIEMSGSVTDGARLFFTEGAGDQGLTPILAQVSSDGGETVPLQVPFEGSVILDISPSGSELLVVSFSDNPEMDHALWAVPALGGSPRRLGGVKSLFAAWSPDGNKLVYAQGSELYLARSDGTDSHKLVTVPGIPGWVETYIPDSVRWSPDGERIRFSVQDPKTLSFALWEVSADGSNLHPLLPEWNNPPAECCGVWSPDGRYFVFQSTRNGRTDLWAIRDKVNLFERASRKPMQLTAGPMSFLGPDVSRDGKKLFALGIQNKNELVRYDLVSKQFVRYLSGMSAEGVDFSKDGQWVTYVAIPQGTLWRSKLDGSERSQLTFPPLQVASPRWSPDGKQIAFMARLPANLWQIYLVPAEGGSPQQVVSDRENEFEPDWSPSGNQLVFSQFPWLKTSVSSKVVIQLLDLRTQQASILPGSDGLYSAHWSSDGRYIAASTAESPELRVFDVATQKWTTLSQIGGTILGWSRNNNYIYFEHNDAVYRIGVHRGRLEQVASLKGVQRGTGILGFRNWAALAPDDSVLLMREASSEEIYALDWEMP
jgi:serine/threonine protein kinase/Tol biopolymer transport system component